MQILAGAERDVQWAQADDEPGAFVAAGAEGTAGPVFRIKGLGYLEAQEYLLAEGGDAARVLDVVRRGLVSIDGSAERAAEFIASPKPRMVTPLFNAIWGDTWGN